MAIHKVVINNVLYDNIGKIEVEREIEYYHNVTALDGTKYQDVRYTKTNYHSTPFNLLDGKYTTLRDYIKANEGTPITCGFPNDSDGFDYADYYISITKPSIMKGYLRNNYYKTGMELYFEAVNADE